MQNTQAIADLVNENTTLIWVETPTNPMKNIIDIKAGGAVAQKHKVLLAVDNTFATP
jgi:cystathionine beta-lyase